VKRNPYIALCEAVKQSQRGLVEAWTFVPSGTPVIVTKDDGSEFHTKTRSGPWMLGEDGNGKGGHTAVIMVDGIAGCYGLERVRRVL
jgi:hypothetical protein